MDGKNKQNAKGDLTAYRQSYVRCKKNTTTYSPTRERILSQ